MTKKQKHALGNILSEYPQDWTFKQIIEGLKNESSEITIWEPFEDYPAEYVIDQIMSQL
jgi:hypothetical protein